MATMRTAMMRSSATACRPTAVARPTAVLRSVRPAISVQAQKQDSASAIAPAIAISAAVSNLMVSGNALAATELAQIAAGGWAYRNPASAGSCASALVSC